MEGRRAFVAALRAALPLLAIVVLASRGAAQVRISQLYAGGGAPAAHFASDFIELRNLGAPQPLAGWSVQTSSGTGSTWSVTPLPALVLGTGEYLLIEQPGSASSPPPNSLALPPADVAGTSSLPPFDGKVALCGTAVPLSGATPVDPAILDLVGYGPSASWNEPGAPFDANANAPSPGVHGALRRIGCASQDTDRNASDFAVAVPSPRNRATSRAFGLTAGAACAPRVAEPAQSVRLVVDPSRCGVGALSNSAAVLVDLSSVGGSPGTALNDQGLAGDEHAGDGLWSVAFAIPGGASAGPRSLAVDLLDGALGGGLYASLHVAPASAPDNDGCEQAEELLAPYPVAAAGSFSAATAESNPVLHVASSAQTMGARRGLWYRFTGTGNEMTVDTCSSPLHQGAIPDTVLMILGGTCDARSEVAFDDDAPGLCGAGVGVERRSSATFCSEAGRTYWAWVAPYVNGAQDFSFVITVRDGPGPCAGALATAPCPPSAFAAVLEEDEPAFGPAADDGCDSSAAAFADVSPGTQPLAIHGTARQDGSHRDTDWYRFLASASDLLSASLSAQFHGKLELHELSPSGECGSSTLVAESPVSERCGSTWISSSVVGGRWYAVRVVPQNTYYGQVLGGFASGATATHYRLELQLGGRPANDDCANALPLALGTAAQGTTEFALPDGSSGCDPAGGDVWYEVTLASAGTLQVDTCGSSIDTALSVHSACGGAALACSDDCGGAPCGSGASCLSLPGTPAGTYRIRVSDKGAPGAFQVRASYAFDHDVCGGAIPVTSPSSTAGTTYGAQVDPGLPPCRGPLGDQDLSVTAPGVWYRLVLPGAPGLDDQTVYADTLQSSYDTKLSVFRGSCGGLVGITANDDMSFLLGSRVAWRAVAGTSYYLLVHGSGSSTGPFTLRITSVETPHNDLCAAAADLAPEGGSVSGTLAGATGAASSFGATALASCASTYTAFDVWYALVPGCDTTVTFDTCGATDTVVSLHGPCPTFHVPNAIPGACNDEAGPGCAPGSLLSVPVLGGTRYLVRVALKDGAQDGGAFQLTWAMADSDGDAVSDCFDGCPFDPSKTAPGQCGCGAPDTDSDGDGTADCVDGCPLDPLKTEPGACGCGTRDVDSDGDGVLDCFDGCPNDPLKIAPGACGCGVPDTDGDGDGTPDCVDGCPNDPLKIAPGACGCGMPDTDSDGDGAPDCLDGCPHDPLKTAPGTCGCGVPDDDVDGDGVLDCEDNCPTLFNPGQLDCDLDGRGDACELAVGTQWDVDGDGLPDQCEPGAVLSYCTAGTSSGGCVATMSATGTPSASQPSGFVVAGDGLDGQRQGLLFYALDGPLVAPWGAGTSFLCVKPPTQRTVAAGSGGTPGACDGRIAIDFLAYVAATPSALGHPLAAGQVFAAQCWYRDPPSSKGTSLSDALQWTMLP